MVREHIERLVGVVSDEVNENLLVEEGEKLLIELRKSWRYEKEKFSNDDIETLQKLAKRIEAVKIFIQEQEEFPYVYVKEDADEIIARLYSVVKQIDGLKVAARVHKEIRELLEKKSNLPSQDVQQRSVELSRAISALNSNAPSCKKCGSRMVLRQGNSDYFWGCSKFPRCWGKRWLTNDEFDILPD